VEGNVLNGNFTRGIEISQEGTSTVDIDVLGNTLSGAYTFEGISYFGNGTTASAILDITGNTVGGDHSQGIQIFTVSNASVTATVSGNQLTGEYENAIHLVADNTATVDATIASNTLSGSQLNGIRGELRGTSGDLTMDVLNNELRGSVTLSGISYRSEGATNDGEASGTIQGNVLSGTFGQGIYLITGTRAGSEDFTIADNVLRGSFGANGIFVQDFSAALATTTIGIRDNTLSGNFTAGNGISILVVSPAGTVPMSASITGNRFEGSFLRGLNIDARGSDTLNAVVSNNVFAAGSSYTTQEILFSTFISANLAVTQFDGNILEGTSPVGIRLSRETGGVITVNGTLNPALSNEVSNETGNKLETNNMTLPAHGGGQFYLNGNLITLPTTVP
jgi:hypothetical protein